MQQRSSEKDSDLTAIYRYLFNTIYPTNITDKQQKKINKILEKIKRGVPLSHVFKCQNFYGHDFYVNKHVLAPRPETELLVEQVIKANPKSVLDLCTGSGCIAATIARHTGAKVDACDISRKALKVAKHNGVEAFKSDLFSNVKNKYDIIVSNPPYIRTREIGKLSKNEPKIAFDGGVDGLWFYRRIAKEVLEFLNNDGTLMLEVGYDQARDVKTIFDEYFKNIVIIKDYNEIERIIICKKN